MRRALYAGLGFALASVVALTTDQIIQNVYDSANTALRANVVVGSIGGGPTPTPQPTPTPLAFGTNGVIVAFNATELGSYGGSSCGSGFATATSASGVLTCATPVPPAPASTATPQPTATPQSPTYRSSGTTGTNSTNLTSAAAHNYLAFGVTRDTNNTSVSRQNIVPIALTVKNLDCYITTAPASTTSWAYTLWTGTCGSTLSASALTCTITGNGTLQTCTDGTHSVSITAGQCAQIDVIGTNSPTAASTMCSYELDH